MFGVLRLLVAFGPQSLRNTCVSMVHIGEPHASDLPEKTGLSALWRAFLFSGRTELNLADVLSEFQCHVCL
eukprot:m.355773 g.355773  ORF g.355773 m.355773 type:complete len:71 (-) comp17333_c0_seq1:2633-2845(-)